MTERYWICENRVQMGSGQGARVGLTVAVCVTCLVVTAGNAVASNWAWPKRWAEYYVGGNIGLATACRGLGAPYRQGGVNYYYQLSCLVGFNNGAVFQMVIKPTGKTTYRTLSTRQIKGPSGGGGVYADTGSGHWITDKSYDASVITLEDGSRWLTSPYDRYNAITWVLIDDITVEDNSDPSYPYTLINTSDGSSVSARFLGF